MLPITPHLHNSNPDPNYQTAAYPQCIRIRSGSVECRLSAAWQWLASPEGVCACVLSTVRGVSLHLSRYSVLSPPGRKV
eukprot:358375-Chlamydomonas_euryale.AAC.21